MELFIMWSNKNQIAVFNNVLREIVWMNLY